MKLDRDLKDLKVLFDEDTLQKRIKELAKEINVARNTVTQYEKNLARPSYEVLVAIAKYFNVSTDYLLGLEDEAGRKTYEKTFNSHIIDNHGTINQTIR